MVRKINHPKIKMMIDVGNCVMENDDMDDAFNYKDIIHHVHISAPFMNPLSCHNYNIELYSNFIQLLKKINYNKIVSLEFLNNHNDTGTELETLNTSICNFLDMCAFSS
jgi:sugar phosphate isomerase/epimerase